MIKNNAKTLDNVRGFVYNTFVFPLSGNICLEKEHKQTTSVGVC